MTGTDGDLTEYPGGISEGHGPFPLWIWFVILLSIAFALLVAPFSLFNP